MSYQRRYHRISKLMKANRHMRDNQFGGLKRSPVLLRMRRDYELSGIDMRHNRTIPDYGDSYEKHLPMADWCIRPQL